ncbi:ABC transporter permease [Conexibacter sp. CPCC 206217]|uniref:ABC transporter permease n=1 Tax=Conexibacter sp. CPCC 206217 TaxID=3064574 RepID=UPI0027259C11|nr:ABC transporter permease [Conexibacter sp. CPCC 206217]MDO8213129.1 ABC transporter permease [Conexibacter sp. CPCC 206217]
MNQIFLFAVLGLGSGALIAGTAVGLVVFHRGAGVVNLAAGAIAMIAGFAFWRFRTPGLSLGTGPALVLCLLVCVLVGLFFEFVIFRPLRTAPPLAKLIATLGALLLAQAGMQLTFGQSPRTEPSILPTGRIEMFGVGVPTDGLVLAGIVLVTALLLAALYRWTLFGLATRAGSESEVYATLFGLSPNVLSGINSVLACVIAGMVGVLAAPLITLDTQTLPLVVVPALAAALLAGFTSPVGACAAGLGLGIVQSLLYYASIQSWFPKSAGQPMPGVFDLVVFLVIIGAMYWRGNRIPGRGELIEQRLPLAPRPERLLQPALIAAALGVLALIVFPGDFRQALMNSMIGTIVVLSLVLLTGFVGQVSVMQLALSGVAGLALSHLAVDLGIGFPFGPIIAAVVATGVGVALAMGGLRARGVDLAVVTVAGAVMIQNLLFANPSFGAGLTGAPIQEPKLLGLNLGNQASFRGLDGQLPSPVLGFVVLAAAILLCVMVSNVRRSGLGRRMLAVRANERAAAAASVNVRMVKLTAFALAAFIAGVAGVLYGYNFGGVSAGRFSALTALSLIAFAYISGISMVSGAVLAGFLAVQGLAQYAMLKWFGINGNWANLFAGVALIANVIFVPAGTAGMQYAKRRRKETMRAAGLSKPSVLGRVWGS